MTKICITGDGKIESKTLVVEDTIKDLNITNSGKVSPKQAKKQSFILEGDGNIVNKISLKIG